MEPMAGPGRWPNVVAGGVGVAPNESLGQAGYVQAQCAMALRQLYGWLQATVPQTPQLSDAVLPAVQAVRLYRAGQGQACLAQVQAVLGLIGRADPLISPPANPPPR
jgi:hypothetical protein